ncbi:MotA/TolQ/ExbB proton channel family protein [Planctomycetes bacterium K23_9]|uniref:Biopolymer transport protein ExbB n=1 Tax=Stieleria marina TaxID=1930275 RepID=A0A517NV95_9BACT|nr:biopolymer transport protein ExbB [Planctomycetes bacterium K23_9]
MNQKSKTKSRRTPSGNDRESRRFIAPVNRSLPSRGKGLLSRLIPLGVLAIGALWLMTVMQKADAQYPQQYPRQFQNQSNGQQFQPVRQNFPSNSQSVSAPAFRTAAAPTIPSAAQLQPVASPALQNDATADESAESLMSGWELPAFVTKIMQGGWLMLPLALCSLIVLALSMERMVALRRGRVIPRPFVRRFTECVEDGQLSYEEATEICKEFDCPVSEVFRAALRRWGRPMLEIEQAVMDAGDRVAERLRRFLRVFHAISNVAPLIGLLGTVIGMIEAFDMISTQDSIGRPEVLAGGISMALMTTAGGLCVAIPAYLAYMYFSSKSDRYLGEIDKLCQRVVDSISAEGLEDAGARGKKRRAA